MWDSESIHLAILVTSPRVQMFASAIAIVVEMCGSFTCARKFRTAEMNVCMDRPIERHFLRTASGSTDHRVGPQLAYEHTDCNRHVKRLALVLCVCGLGAIGARSQPEHCTARNRCSRACCADV